jgi:hypothetical protein
MEPVFEARGAVLLEAMEKVHPDAIIQDNMETTCGHPGLSIWLLHTGHLLTTALERSKNCHCTMLSSIRPPQRGECM